MPTEPVEIAVTAIELSLLLGGAFLIFQLLTNPGRRLRWLAPCPPPFWRVTLAEFAIFILLIFGCGVFFQLVLNLLLKDLIASSPDSTGLNLCLNGVGQDGGGLIGWLYRLLPRSREVLE